MESVLLFSLMSVCLADSHMLGDPWSLSGGLDESAVEHSWSLINQMKYQHVDNELHGEQPKGEGLKCVGFIHRISQNSLPRTPKQAEKTFNEYSIKCLIKD